ncbi:hypothetical protein ABN075_04450 [Providencia rettgeri]
MNNISYMRKEFETLDGRDSGLVFNGGSGGGGDMESRITKLEYDVSDIKSTLTDIKADMNTAKSDIGTLKTDVAVIKSNYAKKEDVVSSANKIILWVAGVVIFSQLLPAMPNIIEAVGKLIG